MAEPMTYKAAHERFELPAPSARPGLTLADRLQIAKAEGRTPVLTPAELVEMEYERQARELTPQMTGALPSRGPVDDPQQLVQQQTGPQYDPAADSPLFEALAPEPPAMEKPPTLHTPEELAAGIGRPEGPPTLSRPLPDRGEAPMPPDAGQRSGPPKWLRGIFTGLDIFEGAARGAAAAEGAGSFLAGAGRASDANRQRGMQEQAHAADQRAAAARAGRIEAETAALPGQLDLERQTQEILNFQREQAAQYTAILTKQIAERLKQAPDRMRLENLRIISDLAVNKARELAQRRLLGQGKTQEEIDLIMSRVETERERQNYLRSGAGLREAQEARQWAETGDVGKTERVRPLSPLQIRKDIVAIQNQLRERHTNPITQRLDEVALAQDPDLQLLQDLEELYQDSLRRYREGVDGAPSPSAHPSRPGGIPRGSASPFGLPGRPPADFEALVNRRFPPPSR